LCSVFFGPIVNIVLTFLKKDLPLPSNNLNKASGEGSTMAMGPLQELIAAARGEIEVDLLLAGGDVANVLSGEVYRTDVAIHNGRIAGFDCCSAFQVLDVSGKILAPGFIDGHVHIESAMVTVPEFARAVVPRGTTTVIADPHEIANVWGEAGIRYMLKSSRDLPLNVFVMLPSQ